MSRQKRGFTLIELLVVIAIIAILAAILFPVFAQARAQARKTTCISNVKQLSLAVLMYDQDFDEMLPLLLAPAPGRPDVLGSTATWHNLVQPYIKNWGITICPQNFLTHADPVNYLDPFLNYGIPPKSQVDGVPQWADTYYGAGQVGNFSVTVQWQGIGGAFHDNLWSTPKDTPSAALAEITSPASMTLVTDSSAPEWWGITYGPGGWDTDFFHYCTTWYPEYQAQRFGPIGRHLQNRQTSCGSIVGSGGQLIAAMSDGHVKSFPIMQYFSKKISTQTGKLVYQYLWPSE